MQPRSRVQAFDVARGYQFHVRLTCDWPTHSGSEMRSTVLAFWMLVVIVDIHLHDLTVVHIRAKGLLNCLNVSAQRISRNLHSVSHPTGDIMDKLGRGNQISLSAFECRN